VPPSGLDYVAPAVRTMRNFFGRYGTVGASFRGIWNGIIPVAVVDRYRDDTEGSLFGLTATNTQPAGVHSAFAFGSISDDWELVACNVGVQHTGPLPGATERFNFMLYTPDFTFIPVTTPSPVGFFVPGLNTDFAFTLGSVTGVAGHNPTLPTRFGTFPFDTSSLSNFSAVGNVFPRGERQFDPPIRIYRDVTLGLTMIEQPTIPLSITVSIRYSIRPRTTAGPRTG